MKRPGQLRSRSAPLRSREPARGKPMKKVNRKRKAANLERAHGPAERREWIKTLPCANCGIVGYSEGAHIRNGGMSRKADARFTIALCASRVALIGGVNFPISGCHYAQHRYGWTYLATLDTPEKREAAAARTEQLWLAHRSAGRTHQETDRDD